MSKVVIDFLKKHGMYYNDFDLSEQVELFIAQMKKGLKGETSSLLMIPSYITRSKSLPYNEKVIAIDAGGTNLRASLISFAQDGSISKEFFNKIQMPGVDKEINKISFFNIIAKLIEPMLAHSSKIGFCFSYPAESSSNGDAKLLRWTKEIKASEVVGCYVADELKQAIKRLGNNDQVEVVVVNDTVSTLLTALLHSNRPFDGYMGYILGTGSNTAYEEVNSAIIKEKFEDPNSRQIINIESGNYSSVPRGDFDKEANLSWKSDGSFLEKMISGAYLGTLITITIKGAIIDGLFSVNFATKLSNIIDKIELKDISDYLANPYNKDLLISNSFDSDDLEDSENLYALIDLMVMRTAKLVAINLCGPLVQSGLGKTALNPVCINVDGTVYYNIPNMQDRIKYFMADYFTHNNNNNCYYTFAKIDDASLLGSAVAILIK